MLDLDDALDHLAPEVDLAASRAMFDRGRAHHDVRRRSGRHRSIVVAVAAAILLVLGVAIVVVSGGDRATTLQTADESAPPSSVEPAPTEPTEVPLDADVIATVALPPVGAPYSMLLDDGMPIWVVHHADGTASVLPGITMSPIDIPDDGSVTVPEGSGHLVSWGSDGGFHSVGSWDEWGRSHGGVPGGTVDDLVGFAAEVRGDEVLVRRSTATDVPGEPVAPVGTPNPQEQPALPAPAPIDALRTGWNWVDVALVGSGDDYRLCALPAADPVTFERTCPPGSPAAPVAGLPGVNSSSAASLLVEVDATGAIITVIRIGPTLSAGAVTPPSSTGR
jgi:hypothetical protein